VTLAPIELPTTLRQSLLARADACRRSAYLMLRHPDQQAHELHFGSAAHAFLERLITDLIQQGEPSLYAPAEGEDPVAAAKQVASLSAAMVDEVLREHPEWPVPIAHPSHSVDHLRQIAYHLAVGLPVDPAAVLGVEQSFELDLENGWLLTGRLDVLSQARDDTLEVSDLKSTFNVESESGFSSLFQMRLYALLAMFGFPVDSGGNRLMPVGEGVGWVQARHLYGRYLTDENEVRTVGTVFSRQEIQDWRHDVERLATDVVDRMGVDSLDAWPATPGSHCSQCAAPQECPLPPKLRDYAGTVNTVEQASLALGAADRTSAVVNATRKEVREFAKRAGPIRVGDGEYRWVETEKWDTDWEGLEAAVFEAVNFGAAFDLSLYRRRKSGTSFKFVKGEPAELREEAKANGERFGDSAPF
jgi:RecB family exonuclease